MKSKGSRRALLAVDGFAGVAALVGMAIVVFSWGYQLPSRWLDGTPFGSYTNLATNWQQGLYFGIGVAMVALAIRINRGGWHNVLPRHGQDRQAGTRPVPGGMPER